MIRSSVVLALLLLAAPAHAAVPATGLWKGDGVSLSVGEDGGERAISGMRASVTQQCSTGATTIVVRLAHVPVRADGSFSGAEGDFEVSGRFGTARTASGTLTVLPGARECQKAVVRFAVHHVRSLGPRPTSGPPVLESFRPMGRIAEGRVAGYDLREEAQSFEYRIRAERVEARVQRRTASGWVTLGTAKARPPRPLDFWPIFSRMGNGTYRVLARAQNGIGARARYSKPRIVRFEVVSHIPHTD